MGINPIADMGKRLAEQSLMERRLAENITPDDPSEQIVLGSSNSLRIIPLSLTVTKLVPDDGALVFDRIIEGQMFDNDEKSFDTGYDESQTVVVYEENF